MIACQDRETGIALLRAGLNVSDITLARLEVYCSLLTKWQKTHNLVSRETRDEFWLRHVCDCARLQLLVPSACYWLDFGSGAGFPAIVTAILQQAWIDEGAHGHVAMIESNQKKVAFLRSVIRETGIAASVFSGRIESVSVGQFFKVTHLSARALAPLNELMGYASGFLAQGARAYFHKGRDIDKEIEEAANNWMFDLIKHRVGFSSDWPEDSVILEIGNVQRKLTRVDQ